MKNKYSFILRISLYVVFILLSLACASTAKTGVYEENYEEIVDIEGTKSDIFTKANLVFVDVFVNAESVIQYSDKEAGVIKGKYFSTVGVFRLYNVSSIIEVSVKDGKYRIKMTISEITTKNLGQTVPVAPNDTILKLLTDEWQTLAKRFKAGMHENSSW